MGRPARGTAKASREQAIGGTGDYEKQSAADALRESEQKFRLLAEQSLMGVAIMQDGQVRYANQAMADLYGVALVELLSMPAKELLASTHPADAAVLAEAIAMLRRGETEAIERLGYRMVSRHGEELCVESYLRTVVLGGQPALMMTTTDATERVLAERTTQAQRDMGVALSSAHGLDQTLTCCLDAALLIGELDGGTLHLVHEVTEELVQCCQSGAPVEPNTIQPRYGADSAFVRLVNFGKPLYASTGALATELDSPEPAAHSRALAIVPISHDERVIGCLCLFSTSAAAVTRSARISLQAIGALIGNAVARVRAEEALRASEERHRRWMDESPVPLAVARDGVFVYANRALCALTGYERVEQLIGLPMLELVHPDDRETVYDSHRRRLAGEDPPSPYDIRIVRRDGAVLWIEFHAERCEFEGHAAGQAALVDITQPKQTELVRQVLLQIAEATSATENLKALLAIVQRELGKLLEARNMFVALYDEPSQLYSFPYAVDELDTDFTPQALAGSLTEQVRLTGTAVLWNAGEPLPGAAAEVGPQGPRAHSWLGVPLRTVGGVTGVLAVQSYDESLCYTEQDAQLLTVVSGSIAMAIDRKRALEALRSSEFQYRSTLESMGDAIHVIDRDYRVILHNQSLAQWHLDFGLGGPIEGRLLPEIYPHLSDSVWAEYEQVFATGRMVVTEEQGELAGRPVAVEARKIPVMEGDDVVRVVTVLRNIGKRKEAEAALRESEERHRRFVEGTIDLVLQVDGEGRLTYVNPMAARLLEIDAEGCLGQSIWDFVHRDERQRTMLSVSRMIRERQASASYEGRIVNSGGEVFDVLWTVDLEYAPDGQLARLNAILHDITEHKRLTHQLITEQKEESMLTLAGGIAHDFNNILMGVLGSATLLRDSQSLEADGRELCSAITTSAERMVDLTSKLLAYARGGRKLPQPVSINDAVVDTLSMVRGSLATNTEVELELADDLWPVEADTGQLHQVFLNLIVNAAEAMPAGGQITATTGNVRRDRDWTCAGHVLHAAGDYVFVEIADSGPGMDAKVLARVFEPFFSTKFQGRGLGLAAARGIVLAHGGCIHAHSQPGSGTQFHVYLPRTDKPLTEVVAEPFVSVPCDETVLMIDDEEIVRRTACRMLERQGFTVLTAASGAEGLELFETHRADIDLVMFDMSMPQMSGAEFYLLLRELDAEVRAIAVSGYSESVALAAIDTEGLNAFVQKPFAFKLLISKVREVLDT